MENQTVKPATDLLTMIAEAIMQGCHGVYVDDAVKAAEGVIRALGLQPHLASNESQNRFDFDLRCNCVYPKRTPQAMSDTLLHPRIAAVLAAHRNYGNDCECGWVDTTGLYKEFTGHEQHVADAVIRELDLALWENLETHETD